MNVIRRLIGLLATILGGVGVVACVAGLVGTWVLRSRVDTAIAGIVERVDGVLSKVEGRTRQANQRMEGTRDAARRLNDRVQQHMAKLLDVPTAEAPDIDEIERQLYARIQLGRDWIGFVQSGVDLVEQFVQMLKSTSLFLQEDSKTRADVIAAVRAGHEQIEETFQLAEEVKTHLENIRAHRDLDESAKQIRSLSSRIDGALEKVQRFGKDFETGVTQLGTDAQNLASHIRSRLVVFAVIINVILVWFAGAQACLAYCGWCILRARP